MDATTKALRCPACGRRNASEANFCSHCGAPLSRGRTPGRRGLGSRGRTALLGALVVAASLLGLWRLSPEPLDPDGPGNAGTESIGDPPDAQVRVDREPHGRDARDLSAGVVSIAHRLGLELARVPAVVLSGRWIALPVTACYGGDRWRFTQAAGRSYEIVSGWWRDGFPVALWRLEEAATVPGPGLVTWRPGVPLTWRSLVSHARRDAFAVQVVERSEWLALVSDPQIPGEPGVYLQEGQVVGWTFETGLEHGVLWTGPPGAALESDIRVDHFYSLTFANGREEQFIRALSMGGDTPDLERLDALAEGFRLRPELAPDHTPAVLRPAAVSLRMRTVASELLAKGFAREVADQLDPEVLRSAGDADLMDLAIRAMVRYYGEPAALNLAEALLEDPGIPIGPELLRMQARIKALCIRWIRERIDQSDPLGAWRAYQRSEDLFPRDPDLRVLGAEIALNDGDWRTAKALLPAPGTVSADLAGRVDGLAERAARLKAEEGKIVIRFQPGRRHIPVRATLNHRVEQDFVIDTGASMVTIPSDTARALGLRLDERTPQRRVSTAGGPVLAREVTLASIALEGRTVNDIRAWVLDIPGHPETGLLGLSYLNRFHVEIDNGQGVLMLTPR